MIGGDSEVQVGERTHCNFLFYLLCQVQSTKHNAQSAKYNAQSQRIRAYSVLTCEANPRPAQVSRLSASRTFYHPPSAASVWWILQLDYFGLLGYFGDSTRNGQP